jgi:hypothetical protein
MNILSAGQLEIIQAAVKSYLTRKSIAKKMSLKVNFRLQKVWMNGYES